MARFIARLRGYLEEHPAVTAILPLNDSNAIHCWRVLQDAGYRIPEDISIIGFDDTDPLPDSNGNNLLTSVHLPLEEIGRETIRLLIRQIESRQMEQVEICLPVTLRVRNSTGPARPRTKE